MSVHYKFKSALDYDTVTFDGLHISVGDLKAAISQQKRIGKTSDFDLEITNAQTKEVYVDDHTLIPKNTSLLVARVPLSQQPKKHWDGNNTSASTLHKDVAPNKGLADLSRMEGSEQDKINAMISQSTFDYDPSNYQKIRGQNQRGAVPPNYTCYKCQKRGHWIKDCPLANSGEPVEIRRSTGIPQSFMVPVEGPKAPGAMMTPTGSFAVPVVDREAYLASENAGGGDTNNAPAAPETSVPDELICSLCRDLLTDAVMIPCCGNSFCDECIRGALLDSEDHECPDCREKEIAPTTLIPNRFLRNSVSSFRNQTGYSRRMPHRAPALAPAPANVEMPLVLPPRDARPAAAAEPSNGPAQVAASIANERRSCEESDGSGDDNITVKVPPAHAHVARAPPARHPHAARALHAAHRHARYGPPAGMKPPGIDAPVNMPPRIDEQRASTPTVDERRDPMAQPIYNRGPPPSQFVPGRPPPSRHFNAPPFGRPPLGAPGPFNDRFPRDPYQPPPPGIKDSPNGPSEDPLEAFNRMLREKEMRAKRREERRRAASGSRSPRSPRFRSSRSPRSPRPIRSSRSPRPPRSSRSPRPPRSSRSPRPPRSSRSPRPARLSRSPRAVRASRSPRAVHSSRSPRPPRSPRSPRAIRSSRSPRAIRSSRSPRAIRSSRSPRAIRSPRSPRGPRSPRPRMRPRSSSRLRYSRSPSIPRGRLRRSPWSPRRRRTRERTLSLTRSPSPRRRHRSPLRYRSPLRSPLRSPPRSPPLRSPLRSPHRAGARSPRPISPHRYAGVYDELLSPPRRNVEPPYGARYPRNNVPPTNYPPMGVKPIPQLMNMTLAPDQPPPGYRGRYEGPPFDAGPPGVEPPVPGFEPPPFEKPPFGPPLAIDRERLQPAPFRDPYGSRPPPYEGPGPFREMPLPIPNEIQVHVGDTRFRDNFRQGPPPFRDQGPAPFREGQPFRDSVPQVPYRDANFRGGIPPYRDGPYRNVPFREGGFRDNAPHGTFREAPPGFRPTATDIRDPREPVPANFHDPNYRENYRDESGVPRDARSGYRSSVRSRGVPRRHPNVDHERHREGRERDGHDRDRYVEQSDRVDRTRDPDRSRDPDRKPGREGRSRDERSRDFEKERDHERLTPEKKSRTSPKRSREIRDKRRSESKGRSRERDREAKRDKKEERSRDKSSPDRIKEHKDKDKKMKDRKKKKREKEKDSDKKKKRDKKEKKDKDSKKDEEAANDEEPKEMDGTIIKAEPSFEQSEHNDKPETKEETVTNNDKTPKTEPEEPQLDDLYGDESAETVDKKIMETYIKTEVNDPGDIVKSSDKIIEPYKDEPFDGIELQANADELDLKPEPEVPNSNKEMLAPLPELSKWEVDEDHPEKAREPGEITSPETEEDGGKVTSDVIKRAENAIFAKAINSLRPIEIKKISSDRLKLYGDEPPNEKKPMNNIQITVPVEAKPGSIETNEKKPRYSKTPPPRLSVKDRLGGKVEDLRRPRDSRVVHSTVELVKSRSKTPKKEQPYRRVTVEKDKSRKQDTNRPDTKTERRVVAENIKIEKRRGRSPHEKREFDKNVKGDKKKHEIVESRERTLDKTTPNDSKESRERKKSTLDEANFEPDYDETLESDIETKTDSAKKRERSLSPPGNEQKRPKIEAETIKLDLTNVKKKPDSESESSSDSNDSSSSSSSEGRKKKKKKKRSKKKKKRIASDSDSESDSSPDEHKKKKKKRKHKKKSSKKKSKKSKHK